MPVFSGLARRADLAAVLSEGQKQGPDDQHPPKVRTYIVYSGRHSQARTSVSLFDDDPLWSEGELSTLIKRQFGPTGLKHLLGVLIAAEEHSTVPGAPPGGFVFDASRHLDILGYARSNRVRDKGYHTAKQLREAREIVTLLCSLTIVQETRLGPNRGATLKVRLLHDEASAEAWEETVADGQQIKERIVTNEKIFLRFNPHLFNAAVSGTSQTQLEYTHQLKKLSRESARTHGLVLTLGANLPIKFRLNACRPLELTARSFLRMAGIVEEEYTKYEHLDRLENALRYMVEQGYINSFETDRFSYRCGPESSAVESFPARRRGKKTARKAQLELKGNATSRPPEPMEEMWRVEPPGFLRNLLLAAGQAALDVQGDLKQLARLAPQRTRPSQPALPGIDLGGLPPGPDQLLKNVRLKLGLQQGQLAERLGVTQAAISMAESGKRPRMALRLYEAARRL